VAGGGPDDHGRASSPGPVYAAPPVVLGRQVIGVGFDEQLFEHRVHDVPPQAGEGAGGPAAAFAGTTRSSPWDEFQVAYFHRRGQLELLGRAVLVRPAAGED